MRRRRIGPKMGEAVRIVRRAGGAVPCCKYLAERVGPNGSLRYGYDIVGRCLKAGILALDTEDPLAKRGSAGAVTLTEDSP